MINDKIKIIKRKLLFQQDSILNHIYFLLEWYGLLLITSYERKEITKSLQIGPIFTGSTYNITKLKIPSFKKKSLDNLIFYVIDIKA